MQSLIAFTFMFLVLAVVSIFLQKIHAVKVCEMVELEKRKLEDCEQASKVQLLGEGGFFSYTSLEALNSLKIIRSDHIEAQGHHFTSLRIEDNKNLIYEPTTFLPNLTKIIPFPYAKSSVIIIRNNSHLCLPEAVREKLTRMANKQVTIQKCNCFTVNSKNQECSTISIGGGEECVILNGDLCFNSDSKLTNAMIMQLKKVEELYGRLVVNGTIFSDLKFLSSIIWINVNSSQPAVQITNNPNLLSLNLSLEFIGNENEEGQLLKIEDNKKLKFTLMEEEYFRMYMDHDTTGKKCIEPISVKLKPCQIVHPIRKNFLNISECRQLKGNILIDAEYDNLSDPELEQLFSHVQYLEGCLTIRGSSARDITFLHGLVKINCTENRPAVIIEDNPKLETIDIAIYEVVYDPVYTKSKVAYSVKNNPRLWAGEAAYLKALLKATSSEDLIVDYDEIIDKKKNHYAELHEKPDLALLLVVVAVIIVIIGQVVYEFIRRRQIKQQEATNRKPFDF